MSQNWTPPQQPGQPYGAPQYGAPTPPPPAPKNGLGTAGFILGLLAAIFAVIPIIGVVGWPLSIIGIVLSAIGLHRAVKGRASNKVLSLVGLILSVIALILCILWAAAFGKAVSDTSPTAGTISGSPAAGTGNAQGQQTVALGQTYTFPDGLAVSITAPEPYTPSRSAYPPASQVERAVLVTVTVTNGTGKNYDLNTFGSGPKVISNGQSAQEITDVGKLNPAESSTVLPGKSYSYKKAYAVGKQPGELQVEWTRDVLSSPVIFTGQG